MLVSEDLAELHSWHFLRDAKIAEAFTILHWASLQEDFVYFTGLDRLVKSHSPVLSCQQTRE